MNYKTQSSNCLQNSEKRATMTSKIILTWYDNSNSIGKSVDDFIKQHLCLNRWKPSKNFEFPYTEKNWSICLSPHVKVLDPSMLKMYVLFRKN